MKHPSQRSGPSGEPPDEPLGGTAGGDRPAAEPAARAALDARPPDLLALDLDALRAELERLAAGPVPDVDERAEAVRERYSELLEDYGHDPEALTRIRAIGRRIKDLEEADVLPRSLIRRGRSRR